MLSKMDFPETLPHIGTVLGRRWISERHSKTEILSLRPDGTRTTQDDPTARLGVYVWRGKSWKLESVYNSRREAQSAATRIRRENSK